jgi:tRNA U34 2-thiouridine synthase MnmA/TrmU
VILHQPEAGIAPGQACVFYRDGRVLGCCCWIASAESALSGRAA